MYFPLLHLNTFLVGILAGIVLLKFKEKAEKLRWFSRLSYLLGMVIIFLLFTNKTSLALYMNNGLLSPLFFMIIVGIAFDVSPLTKTLSNKFLVFLGNSSYSIYILQYPVYILMQTVLQEKVFQGKAFYLYLTTLLLISGLLYTFFEKKARFLLLSRWQLTKK
jgi:peptidoglycan/LPS O-acetylase OafA/YrhL